MYALLTGDDTRENMKGSLVFLAVRRGDETLALLSGTIIRSDGIVATWPSHLSYLKVKELNATLTVKVLDTKAKHESVLYWMLIFIRI